MRTIFPGKPLFCALSAVFLISCAQMPLYREPDLPEAKTAALEATLPVWIVSIDGERVSNLGVPEDRRIKILPGPHNVEVTYRGTDTKIKDSSEQIGPEMIERKRVSSGNVKLNFIARAGRTYFVNDGREGNKWRPTIGEFETIDVK